MSFPRYPKYKASGVEWLGDVPEGWEVKRLKHIAEKKPFAIVDGPFGTQLKADDYRSSGVPLVRISNLSYDGRFSIEDLVFIDKSKADEVCRSAIRRGDIIVGKTGATIGKSALFDYDDHGIIASSCIKITPDIHKVDSRFVLFAIVSGSFQKTLVNESGGSTRDTINITPFGRLVIAVPPLPEQTAIAEFLDWETGKIDALVAEQRRLIELLKEKRQAVTLHAVTKGVDPHAPMKPSGIDWLGDVPAGWVISALKRVVHLQSGESITADGISEVGPYPVYGGNGLRGFTSEFTHNGDYVLIGRQGALCGNINYAHERFWASEHAVVATPIRAVDIFWLGEMLRTINLNQYSIAAAQPGLSVDLVGRISIPVPPFSEQKKIATYLTKETAKIDALIEEAQNAVDILQERRTALISATVTGQIDVRNSLRN